MKPVVTLQLGSHTAHYFHTAEEAEVHQTLGELTTDLAGTDFFCPHVKCSNCPSYIVDADCNLTLHKLLLQHHPDLPQSHPEYFL